VGSTKAGGCGSTNGPYSKVHIASKGQQQENQQRRVDRALTFSGHDVNLDE
jgi:hypothetical protein